MGATSRRKGATFERVIAHELNEAGYTCKRNLDQYQESDGRDLTVDGPFCFQLKCGKKPNYRQALREAVDSAGSDYAVAITHEDYGDTVAHILWVDFLELISLPDVRRALRRKSPTARIAESLLLEGADGLPPLGRPPLDPPSPTRGKQ